MFVLGWLKAVVVTVLHALGYACVASRLGLRLGALVGASEMPICRKLCRDPPPGPRGPPRWRPPPAISAVYLLSGGRTQGVCA